MIRLKENILIEFDKNVLNELKKYQQKNGEFESGGILMGEIYPLQNKVVVKKVVPSKKAKRNLFGVHIDKQEMQEKLEKIRQQTDFKYYYLGDWHTHPEKRPKPSFIDKISYKKTLKNIIIQTNFVIFLIIGNDDNIEHSMWIKVCFLDKNQFRQKHNK